MIRKAKRREEEKIKTTYRFPPSTLDMNYQ
jgi:hypothetical protein